jgi:hypothetical protein
MLSNDDDGQKANDDRSTEPTNDQNRGPNVTGQVAPSSGSVWCGSSLGELSLPQETIDERSVRTHFDSSGVIVDAGFSGDHTRGGLYAVLSPQQARHLADALETAAAEQERSWGEE